MEKTTSDSTYYPATAMPDRDWWAALWPDPEGVLRAAGIEQNMLVIDLCCGDGYFTAPLGRIVSPHPVVGVDLSSEMLAMARKELAQHQVDNVTLIEGDAGALPKLVDEPVDFVFIANTFHGVPDQTGLSRAVREVLKPGGKFAIVNWYPRPREETPVLDQPRGPATHMRMAPEAVQQVVEPAGFAHKNLVDVGPYHYATIFEAQ